MLDYSVFELIMDARQDKQCAIPVASPYFEYHKIGVPTTSTTTPRFTKSSASADFTRVVWNEKRNNLSLQARIPVEVQLGAGYAKQGFQEYFPSHLFRAYTIIKDGKLNIDSLPITLSSPLYNKFNELGLFKQSKPYSSAATYLLKLDKLPIYRSGAVKDVTLDRLAELTVEYVKVKAKLKTFRELKKDIALKPPILSQLTKKQRTFLAANCITEVGFQPKLELVEPLDSYASFEFFVEVADYATIPSFKTVTPTKKGAHLDVRQAMKEYYDSTIKDFPGRVQQAWLQTKIDTLTQTKSELQDIIQAIKFELAYGLTVPKLISKFGGKQLQVKGNSCLVVVNKTTVPR